LRLEGKFADLVEQDCTAVCRFEYAGPAVEGAGERTPVVAEQGVFDERCRNCAAVNANERLAPARAPLVDHLSYHFFTGACLAADQHRDRSLAHAVDVLEDLDHRRALDNRGFVVQLTGRSDTKASRP
jgi:hypothetical protein